MTPEAEIIDRLTARMGAGHCVDIGAREVHNNNIAPLVLHRGWSALLFEARSRRARALRWNFDGFPVEVRRVWANTRNVNGLVTRCPDVLNIDIDGQDYHVWRALKVNPPVVCIEYNPSKKDNYVMPCIDNYDWKADDDRARYGAGRGAMIALAESKGYGLEADTGHNLIFALA